MPAVQLLSSKVVLHVHQSEQLCVVFTNQSISMSLCSSPACGGGSSGSAVRLEVMGQRSDFITPAALLESADVSSLARQEWCWLRPEGLAGIRIHIAGYRPVQLDLDAVHARCGPLVAERMPLQ